MNTVIVMVILFILSLANIVDAGFQFAAVQSIPTGSVPQAVAIGDLNGDGRSDVIMTTGSANQGHAPDYKLFVFYQDTDGNLQAPVRYGGGKGSSVDLGDLNHDGRPDIVTAVDEGIGVLYQNVDGTFAPIQVISGPGSYMVKVFDINGDGLPDVVSVGWSTNTFEIYLQTPQGALLPAQSYPLGHPGSLAVADVNSDGLPDVIVGNYHSIAIALQQPGGTFATPAYIDLGNGVSITGIAAGDVNGDQKSEIVVSGGSNMPAARIYIIEQNGNGGFKSPVNHTAYDIPGALMIADLNGDGKKDIVVRHNGFPALSVYQQQNEGSLAKYVYFSPFFSGLPNPASLAIGDINGDGLPDIVMTGGDGLLVHRQQPPAQASAWVVDLGNLGGGWSQALGASSDGSVIVGKTGFSVFDSESHAFLWTSPAGMADLGTFLGNNDWDVWGKSIAHAVSGDGSAVVGEAAYDDNGYFAFRHAFRWTQATGMVNLGDFGGANSVAYGISADGTIVTGYSDNSGGMPHAFRWTQAIGMVDLGVFSGGSFSKALGISADGTAIVGEADIAPATVRAFRWTQATGMVNLGTLGGENSKAYAASGDGSVIIGYSENASGDWRAFSWTQATGMVDLGTLPGGSFATALGISKDGDVIVGQGDDSGGNITAFRWTQATGMQSLTDWLAANGKDAGPLAFYSATNISADGKVIVGQLHNAQAFFARVYTPDVDPSLPSVSTAPVSSVTASSALTGGTVISAGNSPVTGSGICWSKAPNPSILDTCLTSGVSAGVFSGTIAGLVPNTPYYVRAYATNASGTSYGSNLQFTTLPAQYALMIKKAGNGKGYLSGFGAPWCNSYPCSWLFDANSSVRVSATPEWGSTFSGWSGSNGSADCSGNGPCTFTINTDSSLTGTFELNRYLLTVTKTGTGSGTVNASPGTLSWAGNTGTETYDYGSVVILTASAASGATVMWTGCDFTDGTASNATCNVQLNLERSVTATFLCNAPAIPTVNSPGSPTAAGTTYNISWSTIAGATSYDICEATNDAFVGEICTNIAGTSKSFSHLPATHTKYFYRVRARNACSAGAFSDSSDMIVYNADLTAIKAEVTCPSSVKINAPLDVTVKLFNETCEIPINIIKKRSMLFGNSDGTLSGLGVFGPLQSSIGPVVVPAATCTDGMLTAAGQSNPFTASVANSVPANMAGSAAQVLVELISADGMITVSGECMTPVLP